MTELVYAYYDCTGQREMWSKLFADIKVPKMDGHVKQTMANLIICNPKSNHYEMLRKKFLFDYNEKYTKAVAMFKTAEHKAARDRKWLEANEAQQAKEKLQALSPDLTEKAFPVTLDDVQEKWLTQTSWRIH